ncbi:MAG: bifunctional nuclease family protein [Candidatus Tectomicrobia bacterium]|nr:bifunctional nuclease family protein [Candidatus Tectomicrobia bacterium]
MLKMKIGMVVFDEAKGAAIVTLTDENSEQIVPIFIGITEAVAIFREVNRTPSPRPMIYDLFQDVLEGLKATITKIVIDSIQENTYFATIFFDVHGSPMVVDARPSDAIVLALKVQAPIYVEERVIEEAKKSGLTLAMESEEEQEEHEGEQGEEERAETAEGEATDDIQQWLENLRPEDFEKPPDNA